MFCPKCGYKNDNDATYCQKCGTNLNKSSKSGKKRKSNSIVKYIIILCVVLVVGVGITAGMLIEENLGNSKISATENNSTENQTSQNVTPQNNQSSNQIISNADAFSLAQSYMSSSNQFDSSSYISTVSLEQNKNVYHAVVRGGDYGMYVGDIYIDAHTCNLIKIYVPPHD